MRYFSTATYREREIDLATAELQAVLDAYNSLFDRSDSAAAVQLAILVSARPDIVAYRAQLASDKCAARLAGKDLMGM